MDYQKIKAEWLAVFASSVSEEQLKKYVFSTGNYLWHIFSWGLVPCLTGEDAKKAFNKTEEKEVLKFYQRNNKSIPSYAELVSKMEADELDLTDDVYIVEKNFKWTYVHTHEWNCGPYFCSREK